MNVDDQLAFFQKNVAFFDRSSDQVLSSVVPHFKPRVVEAGEYLLRQGDSGREVFVVKQGLFEILLEDHRGRSQRIGWAESGDWIGESAVLTDRPRTYTVVARRDSVVYFTDADSFRKAFRPNWSLLRQIAGFLMEQRAKLRKPRPGSILIAASCSRGGELGELVRNSLRKALEIRDDGAYLESEQFKEQFQVEDLKRPSHDPRRIAATEWLNLEQNDHRFVVLMTDMKNSPWNAFVLRQADLVCSFNSVKRDPQPVSREMQIFTTRMSRPAELVLVNPLDNLRDVDPEAWSAPRHLGRVHILSAPHDVQASRLLDQLVDNMAWPERLSEFALFQGISPEQRALIYEELRWTSVDGGQTLISADDPARYIHFVSTGRFVVEPAEDQPERRRRYLGHGESFGLRELMAGAGHRETVRALRDGSVARIRRERFLTLMEDLPSLSRNVATKMAESSLRAGASERQHVSNIVLLPITPHMDVSPIADMLAQASRAFGPSKHLESAIVEGYLGAGMSRIGRGEAGDSNLLEYFHRLEANYTTLVYACDSGDTPWTMRCLRQADRLVLVAEADGSPEIAALERKIMEVLKRTGHAPCHLVLIQRPEAIEGKNTIAWLKPRDYLAGHHHIRKGNRSDLEALARKLTNRAVGVAFSGATIGGVAHLGVFRALVDQNLPMDVVAGSSSGAVAAGLVAMGLSPSDAFKRGSGAQASRHTLFPRQPPYVSLTTGEEMNRLYKQTFGESRLEDQLINCLFTAVDINRHRLVRLRTGPIWLLVRASSSLPVLWPPVWIDDNLLVDGGMVSYLPLDEIREDCAEGLAVASDLDTGTGQEQSAFGNCKRYPQSISGWRVLLERMLSFRKGLRYPKMGDILFHSLCYSSLQARRNAAESESLLVVRPELGAFDRFQADAAALIELERLTYETTKAKLAGKRFSFLG
ncbi:cyclic nucleotide-binding domain-containing protein [Acanthopleuribacter pedis]|uniref:Cyclic nucleotide-binding domain-containing protein n=1 Tax=Acanthopleuribacter pedis TaxID=442870 RepID=A0A8J7U2I8_9BACT|nr:cyclic nucleotide-binding domain-containing protein [Acanthopleuribacter pedis]MBO1319368.1 cyclic nucleotide-binding domain-containing protein [Acanthopleuribacter pedis]